MIKSQDWLDWLSSPVTKAVITHLNSRKDDKISEMLSIEAVNLEELAIRHVAIRSELSGLGELLDLETLAESCEVQANED